MNAEIDSYLDQVSSHVYLFSFTALHVQCRRRRGESKLPRTQQITRFRSQKSKPWRLFHHMGFQLFLVARREKILSFVISLGDGLSWTNGITSCTTPTSTFHNQQLLMPDSHPTVNYTPPPPTLTAHRIPDSLLLLFVTFSSSVNEYITFTS